MALAESKPIPQWIKEPARRGLRTAGRLTHGARMVPDFLIVGAQRCGTTSMFKALRQHPAILRGVLDKGVHYFDLAYDRDFAWYQGHFPLKLAARKVEKQLGVQAMTFESSPFYMFHPLSAERIARDLPDVKLIVMVRDPVERAYSAHAHELARGFETEPFERALELEEERLLGETEKMIADPSYVSFDMQHHAYRARGRYSQQLERMDALFGRDRVHVVDSHVFFSEPERVYDGVLEFLGMRRFDYPPFERHNARPRSPMSETLRSELDDHFRPYDERLAHWLGTVPSWRT